MQMRRIFFIFIIFVFAASCNGQSSSDTTQRVIVGAEQMEQYLPLIKNRKVALIVNQTSLVKNRSLVDTLLDLGIQITKIFTPEHGLRGTLDRGVDYTSKHLSYRGVPVVSLIGRKKAPSKEDLQDVDVIIYDLQDVGVRFFTYISTMFVSMRAAACNGKSFIVLDRPDPNGDYVDGPVLDTNFRSFVGMLPIPVVYGLTPGELALMIKGQGWLNCSKKLDLTVIPIKNYTHMTKYILPVKPSPNLPNYLSIRLYPSLCFFEATDFSVGRGTQFPFQVVGYPDPKFGKFHFIPHDIPGMQMNPIHEGEVCYGIDLRKTPDTVRFTLKYVLNFYHISGWGEKFFKRPHWFDLLAGTDQLRKQILAGWSEKQIRQSWKKDLEKYKKLSSRYLLYP